MKTSFDGDSLWYKEFGDATYNIVVNDIIVTSSNIFVAGQSNKTDVNKTDFYVAKLDLSGVFIFNKSGFIASNSSYQRLFLQPEDNLLFIGTYGEDKVVSMVSVSQSTMNETNPFNTTTINESAADACLAGDQLYLLKNGQSGGSNLSKLNSDNSEVWLSETFNSVVGKSVAYCSDGSLMVCGEAVDDGGFSIIKFIKVNADGTVYMNTDYFKTFLGTAEKIMQTKDKGLIMVGATNSTYGTNVQLIKTDKDYFMLNK